MATSIGKLYAIIRADTSDFNTKVGAIGKLSTAVGKSMTKFLTLPILAIGVAAVKFSADFEQSMKNAQSVSGATAEELKYMEGVAREMGKTTVFSAKEAADAMYFMASAGWDAKKMGDAIKPTLDLAAATQSDLAFTTDAVVASLNQFQLQAIDAERVTNVFAAAIGGSQATLEKLKISMSYVGPIANMLGYEIEETTGSLMGLYNAGYDASTAGTALRMALAKLMDGTGKTKEGLRELGLSMDDVSPKTNSLADIIGKLEERGADATAVIKIFGVRAGPAMGALLAQGADSIRKFTEEITGTDAAAEMAEIQLDTLKGQIKLIISAVSEVAIQIGKILIPVLRDFLEKRIMPLIQGFSDLSEATKKNIVKFAGLLAVAGPLLLIIGKIAQIIPHLSKAFLAFSKIMKGVAFNLLAVVLIFKSFERYFPLVGKALEDAKNKAEALRKELGILVGWAEFERAVERAGLITGEFAAMAKEAGYDVNKFLSIMVKDGRKHAEDYVAIYTYMTEEKERLLEREKKLAEDLHKIEQWAIDDAEAHRKAVKAKITAYYALKGDVEGYIEIMEERIRIEETDADVIKERIAKLNETTTAEGLLYDALNETNEALKESKNLTLEERDQIELSREAIERKIEALLDAGKAQKTFIEALEFTITPAMELARQFAEGKISIIEYTAGLQKLREEAERIKDPFKDLAMVEGEVQDEIDGVIDSYAVLRAAGVPATFYDQLTAIEKLKLGIGKTTEATDLWGESLTGLSGIFRTLSDDYDGALGDLLSTTGSVFDAIANKMDELPEGAKLSFKDLAKTIQPMLGQIGGSIGQMISGAKKSFAGLGASLGGMVGNIFGPIGKAVGSVLGGIVGGLFKKKKALTEAEKAAIKLKAAITSITSDMSKYGEITEDTAKKITESRKAMAGHLAVSKHFADIISDVGVTQENVNKLWSRATDIIHHFADGSLSAADATNALDESFELLLEGVQDLGEEGSKAMVEFIQKVRESGLEVASVTEYVVNQLDRIPAALETLIASQEETGQSMEGLESRTLAAFKAMEASGMNWTNIVHKMSPALNALRERMEETGHTGSAAIKKLFKIAEVTEANKELFDAIEADKTILEALGNTGFLTGDILNEFAKDAIGNYETLKKKFGNSDDALRAMGPTLQKIKDYAETYNITLDEGTQKLIDQAVEIGAVEEAQESNVETQERLFDELGNRMKEIMDDVGDRIVSALGGGFDTAFDNAVSSASKAAGQISKELGAIQPKIGVDFDYQLPKLPEESEEKFQTGFEGIIRKPTRVLMGEVPEHVSIIPLSKMSRAEQTLAATINIENIMEPIIIQRDNEVIIKIVNKGLTHGDVRVPTEAVGG